ncbi:MAG: anaerobic ribonucleoside-triphosphate reductase [Desulfurococcaceae archaeon]
MQEGSEQSDYRDPLVDYAGWNRLDVNENANRYQGPSGFFAWLLDKYLERDAVNLLPKSILKSHADGLIYVHKLPHSVYIPYCTGHSISRLLKKGLRTITIVSRPARHFDTLVDHIANFLITMQHYFTGAQALSSVEWYTGPFIRKDKPSYKQIKQQIQRLLYNLNYPTRIGLQTPFSNFTVTMNAPRKMLEGDQAVYGGEEAGPLGDYEGEAKVFFKALTELYYEGDSVGQPFTFPIPTLMATAKWLWDDPEIHEAVFKTAAKRGSFYWLNTRIVDPDATYAMCLHEKELVVFRHGGTVSATTIGNLFKNYAGQLEAKERDGAEWYSARGDVEALAYSPETGKVAWRKIKRFLAKSCRRAVRISLADGRTFVVTHDHPLLIRGESMLEPRLIMASELLELKIRGSDNKLQPLQVPVALAEMLTSNAYLEIGGAKGGVSATLDEGLGYLIGYSAGLNLREELLQSSPSGKRAPEEAVRERHFTSGLYSPVNSVGPENTGYLYGYELVVGCPLSTREGSNWGGEPYIEPAGGALADLLYSSCVRPLFNEKRIPWFIWSSPPSVRRQFIRGLLDSIGQYREGQWELCIKSEELAQDLLLLASLSGVDAQFKRCEGGTIKLLLNFVDKELDNGVEALARGYRNTADVVWVDISSVEELEFQEDELFVDLELEEDHYFVHSGGVVTHNCCRLSIQKSEMIYAYMNSKLSLSSLRKDAEELKEEFWKAIERQRFGGIWAMPDVTGSVNIVDVNLPRLALESKREEHLFWEKYSEILMLVKEGVDWFRNRYIYIMKNYPNFYAMIQEYMPEFPSTHFNTIGLIGLPEAVAILMGDPNLWLDGPRRNWLRAADLMRRIVEYATNAARKWMTEEGIPWNVEEVPGESAGPKLAMLDLKKYPELAEYLPEPENPVYASSVAPYYAPMELPDRVEVEQRVQRYFTGGVMMHIFLGEEADPESLSSLTKKLIQTDLIYWSYTPAITHCNSCDRTFTGVYTACPSCSSNNVDIWSRIIGYYRPLRNWNPQRRKEFWTRKHYNFNL